MSVRYISAATSLHTPPSPPPKRKVIDLEQVMNESLSIALSTIPPAATSLYTSSPKQKDVDLEELTDKGRNVALSSFPATTQSSHKSPSPQRRRKYSNLQALAQGGLSEVFRAVTSPGKSPIACKVTSSFYAENESKLLNELFMHQTPHSLRCRELCVSKTHHEEANNSSDARAMLVTDLIPARNIHYAFLDHSIPTEDRLKRDEIITIFKSLLQYLAKLKSLRIIHRDLKPGNLIYLRPSRYLTVIDLGSAVNLKQPLKKHPSAHTPAYQAPESILGDQFNPSVDLWSAGCILFEMLTDQELIPFDYKTPKDQKNNHLLQMIAARIGKPSPGHLNLFDKSKGYFNERTAEFIHPLNIQLESWEKVFDSIAEQKKFSAEDKAAWKSILSRLLTYTNRAQAENLLAEEKIFKYDTCFHLRLLNSQVEEIRMIRASLILPTTPKPDFSHADLVIHGKQLANQHCFHIPRDPGDQYLLCFKKKDNTESSAQTLQLEDNCFVNLNDEAIVSYQSIHPVPYETKKAKRILFPELSSSVDASIEGSLKTEKGETGGTLAPTQLDEFTE